MSRHEAFKDLREAAEKMGLPPREIAHILQIAEANRQLNERRAEEVGPEMPPPEGQRQVLTFVEPAKVDLPPPAVLWCEQCDHRVARLKALACGSKWCKAKGKL